MNLWRTLVLDQNISLRMIYREKNTQSLKNDAVKSGCVTVIDSCDLGHITTGLRTTYHHYEYIQAVPYTPAHVFVCPVGHVT